MKLRLEIEVEIEDFDDPSADLNCLIDDAVNCLKQFADEMDTAVVFEDLPAQIWSVGYQIIKLPPL